MIYFLVLLISAFTLLLELVQTRILSVVLWHHFVYITVTMALMGFAASGTVFTCVARLGKMSDRAYYAMCLSGLSVTTVLVTRFGYYHVRDAFSLTPNLKIVLGLAMTYSAYMLPYFFIGLLLIGIFARHKHKINKLYFMNLIGSGFGCLLFVALMSTIGAIKLVLIIALLTALLSIVMLERTQNKFRGALIAWCVILLLALCLATNNSLLLRLDPEPHKQYKALLKGSTVYEWSSWNAISRIDVISDKNNSNRKHILMDGDAQAHLFSPAYAESFVHTVVYYRKTAFKILGRPPERVLVIGAGGGLDPFIADNYKAKRIDAVEINPTTVHLVKEVYDQHLNGLFSKDYIHLYVEDGRSFTQRNVNANYDVIMMHATDSILALSTGAYVLFDNYLYTTEAFKTYLARLSENGVLHVGRWFYPELPRETLRAFTTSFEALKDLGVEDPRNHVIAFASSPKANWANILVKREPFTAPELTRFHDFCRMSSCHILHEPGDISNLPDSAFKAYAKAFGSDSMDDFYSAYPYEVRPATDDRPFFYQQHKWQNLFQDQSNANPYYDRIRGVWFVFVLGSLLIQSILMSLFLVITPLIVAKKRLPEQPRERWFVISYFASIGLGFMLVEMALIQKVVLFLGSPVYSMSVVIPAILIFAGCGSYYSKRLSARLGKHALSVMALVVVGLILALNWIIPCITASLFLQPPAIRILVVIMLLAPVSFVMGMPFPLGINLCSSEKSVPWAWAVNGTASVISSILAVILAMAFGFQAVLLIGACTYLIASLSSYRFTQLQRAD